MRTLRVLGVAALVVALLAVNAMAQRRGGAVRGGVRGAAVGEMVGGESAAKAGAVIGATRGAAQRAAVVTESQARTQYQTTPEYQNAPRSNFVEAPPEVLATSPSTGTDAKGGVEAVIRKGGKAIVAVTFPSDWKQKAGDVQITAISADRQAWVGIATLEGVKDQQAGIEKIKKGLEKHLKEAKYDELKKSKEGALVVTGTGKTMKSGVDVVFAAGVLDSDAGPMIGAAFVVDESVEDHYKEAVRYICQTIRRGKDLANQK